MSVTQFYKNDKYLTPGENGVIALSRSILVLKLVNEAKIDEILNSLKEHARASYADGAVDITVLISYAELHALVTHLGHGALFSVDEFENIGVKVSYLFTDHQGGNHCIHHSVLHYFAKYESVARNEQKMVTA